MPRKPFLTPARLIQQGWGQGFWQKSAGISRGACFRMIHCGIALKGSEAGDLSEIQTGDLQMTKARRLVALLTLFAMAAIVSSFTLGPTAGKKGNDPSAVSPQFSLGKAPANADAAEVPDRFAAGGVLTYQSAKGETHFALQVKHSLPPVKAPRDYVILISTSAAMGGPGWIGARQIAEGIIESSAALKNEAAHRDNVSIWMVSDKKHTRNITNGFLNVLSDQKVLKAHIKNIKEKEYPAGADDLKFALEHAAASFPGKVGRQHLVFSLGTGPTLL